MASARGGRVWVARVAKWITAFSHDFVHDSVSNELDTWMAWRKLVVCSRNDILMMFMRRMLHIHSVRMCAELMVFAMHDATDPARRHNTQNQCHACINHVPCSLVLVICIINYSPLMGFTGEKPKQNQCKRIIHMLATCENEFFSFVPKITTYGNSHAAEHDTAQVTKNFNFHRVVWVR